MCFSLPQNEAVLGNCCGFNRLWFFGVGFLLFGVFVGFHLFHLFHYFIYLLTFCLYTIWGHAVDPSFMQEECLLMWIAPLGAVPGG